jgi:hypothetical protein
MDNLISKWKQTVENHNKKLKNLREESLGRGSLSRERTQAITASSLALQSKGDIANTSSDHLAEASHQSFQSRAQQ